MQQAIGIIDGNLNAHARTAGDDFVVKVAVVLHVAADVKGIGIVQAVDQFAALAAAVGVEDDRVDLANVSVDAETEHNHLQQGNHQGKEKCRRIPPDVQRFLEKDRAKPAK